MPNKVKQETSRSFQEMSELQLTNDNNNTQQQQQQPNGAAPPSLPSTSAEALAGSKRLRRPSVRLGEIGGEQYQSAAAYDYSPRRPRKDVSKSSTRTRALTNLGSGYENPGEREGNVESLGVGSWRVKKRVGGSTTKRVRSNWVSRGGGEEELEGGFRDFSREDSESPIKEESLGRDGGGGGGGGGLGFYGSSGNREFELSGGGEREGVKIWLEELGLGRYWPMFEIHEVDEEVLPLLTLEDLRDMGISAVGSRRKMFCAIQKLGREFS
ncbi:unnamed protein product [Eruca vesicaria subsp. sativa]|uniref:SAM domain-containing protein n=1 Tax=Eruca vesicaria subsp. sativa TaxID=29727 RepID=A0ABC8IRE1_ERUVS|nr:unnamed protein product [Eruca vesicaria subsp. sativa]